MNQQEKQLEQAEQQVREAQLQTHASKLNQAQQEFMLQEENKGMIAEQLDLGDVMDKMHNLLRGYVLRKDENGNTNWVEPENKDLVVLSEYGVSYIMQMLQAYLTKNTLLSNYDDAQINQKMEDFSITLADDIFMEYDKMFLDPTLEECKDEIKRRIQAKVNVRAFALDLMDKEVDKDKIEAEILKEMEGRIERELEVIKEQKRKNKLKRFESIIRMVQDTVHSAYQRAWKGQERTTLRQHTHISETKGGGFFVPQQHQQSGFNPLGILRR